MNTDRSPLGCLIAAFIATLIGAGMFAWYQAGAQVEVYRRQGVEMTTWEVFIGCTPAERQIHFEKSSDQKELEQHDTR